ncbi:MAG: acylphosphatase [Alphaproteobacteria bacterium]|nr:acylphosphatase [Alphaproteobacteria bacterium]
MTSETTIFRLRIKGTVQGVGYREWAIGEATARGLAGWVRNRSDGSVEMLIAGDDAKVQDMLRAATQGPEAAQVANVDIFNESEAPPPGFARKPTL